jgi:hypothetical protein
MSDLTTARRTAWPVALLAALGVTLSGCGGTADDTASDTSAEASAEASVEPQPATELTVGAAPAGRCMVPSAELLQTQDLAFEGTVTGLDGGTATLAVDEWFKGEGSDTVTVASPSQELQDLLIAVDFQEGRTYLVSARGGMVSLCGLTAEKDERLITLYAEAYGG